jgi:hypothetical protein
MAAERRGAGGDQNVRRHHKLGTRETGLIRPRRLAACDGVAIRHACCFRHALPARRVIHEADLGIATSARHELIRPTCTSPGAERDLRAHATLATTCSNRASGRDGRGTSGEALIAENARRASCLRPEIDDGAARARRLRIRPRRPGDSSIPTARAPTRLRFGRPRWLYSWEWARHPRRGHVAGRLPTYCGAKFRQGTMSRGRISRGGERATGSGVASADRKLN